MGNKRETRRQSRAAKQKPYVKIMRVFPDMAARWLQKNIRNNRGLRRGAVLQYTADMASGNWFLSESVIAFDVDGELINGQHRLTSCVRSGNSFEAIVVWNFPKQSFAVIDAGMRRTTEDRFKLQGYTYPFGFGATVRRLFASMRSSSHRPFTDQEIGEFMSRHAKEVAFAHAVLPFGQGKKSASAATRAPIVRATIKRAPRDDLKHFGEVLQSGIMSRNRDCNAVLLRQYIVEQTLHTSRARQNVYAYAEAALHNYLDNTTVKKLTPATRELFPLAGEREWFGGNFEYETNGRMDGEETGDGTES